MSNPSSASRIATARPIPRDPPVTRAQGRTGIVRSPGVDVAEWVSASRSPRPAHDQATDVAVVPDGSHQGKRPDGRIGSPRREQSGDLQSAAGAEALAHKARRSDLVGWHVTKGAAHSVLFRRSEAAQSSRAQRDRADRLGGHAAAPKGALNADGKAAAGA